MIDAAAADAADAEAAAAATALSGTTRHQAAGGTAKERNFARLAVRSILETCLEPSEPSLLVERSIHSTYYNTSSSLKGPFDHGETVGLARVFK